MTTYHAEASLGERYWLIHVAEIDQWTQARNLTEAEAMAKDLIAVCLDTPSESFEVELTISLPETVQRHLARAADRRSAAANAQSEAAGEYRAAAGQLKANGLTVRDIGTALGISHQRVQQLLAPVSRITKKRTLQGK